MVGSKLRVSALRIAKIFIIDNLSLRRSWYAASERQGRVYADALNSPSYIFLRGRPWKHNIEILFHI